MGNLPSFGEKFVYSVPTGPPAGPNETSVYRAASHPDALICSFQDEDNKNAVEFFFNSVKKHGDRRFLGRRFKDPKSGVLGPYVWITYAEAERLALSVGSTLVSEGLVPAIEYPEEELPGARKIKVLGIYAKNCVEWFLAEQACNAYGLTLCPLYDTLGSEAIDFILKQTRMQTILVAFECFNSLLSAIEDPAFEKPARKEGIAVQTLILIDPDCPEDARYSREKYDNEIRRAQELGLLVMLWPEVCRRARSPRSLNQSPSTASAAARSSPRPSVLPPQPAEPDSVHTLCYTSGTTGSPKGVILTHETVVAVVCGALRGPIRAGGLFDVNCTDCVISYLPLAHVFERCVCNIVIAHGGSIGLYSGDMAKLLDDVRVLQPTVFLSVPRLFNRINDKIALSLQDKRYATQILFNQGLNSKINKRRATSVVKNKLWDTVLFNKIREMMGGRIKGMICGGAPLDPIICERMCAFFGAPLMQGYGLSESFGPCFLMHPDDPLSGGVGGVWPSVEFKLISIPELNYFVTDKPFPRGELLLRGPGISKGYFLNPAENQASFQYDAQSGALIGKFNRGGINGNNGASKANNGASNATSNGVNNAASDGANNAPSKGENSQENLNGAKPAKALDSPSNARTEDTPRGKSHNGKFNTRETGAKWPWFHTGDVAVILMPTNSIKIIDRKKNIFKLSQGEYVAPEKIEAVYTQSTLVQQIFVFGYSHKTMLVAIVHPDFDAALKKFKEVESIKQLCQMKEFKTALMMDMEEVAVRNGLKGFEKAREIYLTPEPFTVENNLLTPTSKIRRNEAKEHFRTVIDELYDHLGS